MRCLYALVDISLFEWKTDVCLEKISFSLITLCGCAWEGRCSFMREVQLSQEKEYEIVWTSSEISERLKQITIKWTRFNVHVQDETWLNRVQNLKTQFVIKKKTRSNWPIYEKMIIRKITDLPRYSIYCSYQLVHGQGKRLKPKNFQLQGGGLINCATWSRCPTDLYVK